MRIFELLTILHLEQPLEPVTFEQYRRAAGRFDAFLGRPAEVADLTTENANRWLCWLADTYGIGPTSLINYRAALIRLWNYAADPLDQCEPCPCRRIRRPKQPQRAVNAWTLDQFAALLDAAAGMGGHLTSGMPAAQFLTAWLWVAYETGLRPGDLRRLAWTHIDATAGTITIDQHKTGDIHTARIGTESLAALEIIRQYGLPDVFPVGKSGIYRWERLLYAKAAKNGFTRQPRQGLGTLRKTHATEVYRQYGLAAASESLGHRGSSATAARHYIATSARVGALPPAPAAHRRPAS